ncbi:Protein Tax-1 [Phlyctochytrium bullatum]|nr:Protein Tax-1 [Phlyctochytrium bullatum]
MDSNADVPKIDVQALEEQIRLKNETKKVEKQRELAFDRSMKFTNDILTMMDEHVKRTRREHLAEINQFRRDNQKPEQGRDFDLYDPQARLKDAPARVGDQDPRCGVSGLQKFEGEDLGCDSRKRLQMEQNRVWAEQQLFEKEMRRQALIQDQRNFEEYEGLVTQKINALQQGVKLAREQTAKADKEINERLAEMKRQRELEEKAKETELNHKEILNHVYGEFLTERPDVFNIGGGHKVRVDLFKGMTVEQKSNILKMQDMQRREAEVKREQEREEEARWAFQQAANHRASLLLEREKQRRAREQAVQIRKENEAKAVEDRQR